MIKNIQENNYISLNKLTTSFQYRKKTCPLSLDRAIQIHLQLLFQIHLQLFINCESRLLLK